MPEIIKQVFGVSGTLLAIYAIIPYLVDVAKGHTKPHKMAQIIFMVIAAISFFGQLDQGATASIYLTVLFFIIPIVTLYLSRNTKVGSVTKMDIYTLLLCIGVIIVWSKTSSSELAIILITGVNFIGKILVINKINHNPDSELLLPWVLAVFASLLTVLSVGAFDWVLILPPLHNAITVAIISLIIYKQKKVGTQA